MRSSGRGHHLGWPDCSLWKVTLDCQVGDRLVSPFGVRREDSGEVWAGIEAWGPAPVYVYSVLAWPVVDTMTGEYIFGGPYRDCAKLRKAAPLRTRGSAFGPVVSRIS